MDELIKLNKARQALMEAKDLNEIREIRDIAKAVKAYAQAKSLGRDMINEASEIEIRAIREMGKLIEQGQQKGEIATQNKGGANIPNGVPDRNTVQTLPELEIKRKESSTSKNLASISDNEFEQKINSFIAEKKPLTKTALLKEIVKNNKNKEKQNRQQIANNINEVLKQNITDITKGWHKIGNQFLYYGNNLDIDFIDFLPVCKFGFADPPYNANVDNWDSGFIWEQDIFIDKCEVMAVTPGGWEAFNFYNQTNMPYIWEIICYIKNGMTHGKCGFANYIKASIFSKGKVKIPQDLFSITIKTSETEDTNHKGRKPYEFIAELINMFSSENDNIFDLFAGSGTTLLMSEKMNRISYNAEIDKQFCIDIINRAIENGIKYECI
ncbi:site-specific DNA-methyltransferase [bacterium]|nr:site-specific DNA-methyltransferase [bacterium]